MYTEQQKQHMLQAAEQFARVQLGDDQTGHDWWHVYRVVRMAERLAIAEGADVFLCQLAAWLHDIGDEKLHVTADVGERLVMDWLDNLPLAEQDRAHVADIVATMSYNAGTNPPMRTLEGRVVQDADRLDAIGAIAIARTFLYAGWKGHPLHDPELPPRETMTRNEYRHGRSTAINHFHEKLLRLKDRINTSSAKRIAEERHHYMEQYLRQFEREWAGEDGPRSADD